MKPKCALFVLLSVTLWLPFEVVAAGLKLPAIFSDNMVLQRDKPVPVWGTAQPGTEITVEFAPSTGPGQAGQKKTATAGTKGDWRVTLDPMKADSKPQVLTIRSVPPKQDDTAKKVKKSAPAAPEEVAIKNVLVGDVWLCSGQSNMDMPVGYTRWGGGALNYEEEIKASANSLVRHYSGQPWHARSGKWDIAGPDTTGSFSTTAYFFARELQKEIEIPVAVLGLSQGATPIEVWVQKAAVETDPEFKKLMLAQTHDRDVEYPKRVQKCKDDLAVWEKKYGREDNGLPANTNDWTRVSSDATGWKTITMPFTFAKEGLPHGGVVWLRREFEVPPEANGKRLVFITPHITDAFDVFLNGARIGGRNRLSSWGRYGGWVWLSSQHLRQDKNVIAMRIRGYSGKGGLLNNKIGVFSATPGGETTELISLQGEWLCKVEKEFAALPEGADPFPETLARSAETYMISPGGSFNYLIAKRVVPFAIKGVIWYQGEHNASRGHQYGRLMKLLINDWRKCWGDDRLPFYICQLPTIKTPCEKPEESGWAEVREGQFQALELPDTGVANLIDANEDGDLHPRNKQLVGQRLALIAMRNAYGKDVECYGPMFESMKIHGGKAIIKFKNTGGGLVAKELPATYKNALRTDPKSEKPLVRPVPGSPLQGFAVYGAVALAEGGTSNQWVWADAKIDGDTVVVHSASVKKPLAVRYAWANYPVCNLCNTAGLPAYPFRTDNFPPGEENKK